MVQTTKNTQTAQRTVAFQSLGCKLNQYEIQALREAFEKHGFREVPMNKDPDYFVVNTCTVTQTADKAAKDLIRLFHRRNPDKSIIVTGCYATASPGDVRTMPGVAHVVNNAAKNQILSRVLGTPEVLEENSPFFKGGISYFEEKSRAFIKVQDGCNYFCTFCKVPFVRGRLISRDKLQILEEIKRLLNHGYQEIVLSGVCLGSYGKDLTKRATLTELLEAIVKIPGRFRVRLSSIDPRDTPFEIVKLMKSSDKLCPHLHLPLQSGDDAILARMRRGYTTAQYEALVCQIRREVPRIGLSTDVIVGFPGEDDAAFERTKNFLRKIAFCKVHLFPYSEREGTKAAALDKKVDAGTIRKRKAVLEDFLSPVTERVLRQFENKTLEVLVERKRTRDGFLQGFSGNYIRCLFSGDDALKGTLQTVRVLEAKDQKLFCESVRLL